LLGVLREKKKRVYWGVGGGKELGLLNMGPWLTGTLALQV